VTFSFISGGQCEFPVMDIVSDQLDCRTYEHIHSMSRMWSASHKGLIGQRGEWEKENYILNIIEKKKMVQLAYVTL
jgi:hypothetical protein